MIIRKVMKCARNLKKNLKNIDQHKIKKQLNDTMIEKINSEYIIFNQTIEKELNVVKIPENDVRNIWQKFVQEKAVQKYQDQLISMLNDQ